MSYTANQAVTQVRSIINESSASFWSDTEIGDWIKEATIDISSKLLCVETEDDLTLVADQWIYTDLTALLKIKGCYYNAGSGAIKGMQRKDIQDFGHLPVSSGAPKYFYENNRNVYLWPIPSATEAGNTVTVINSYETDDVTVLRDEHQPLTFLYAAAKAKAKDRMFQESALLMSQYLNTINFERQDKYDFGEDSIKNFAMK